MRYMPERPSFTPEAPRPRFDLSTIQGIPVGEVEVLPDAEAMARDYLDGLAKEKTSQAEMAELAWALRRQLQEDLRHLSEVAPGVSLGELRRKLLQEDETHGFSLAVYRRLTTLASQTIERELVRHEREKNEINGTYEEFKTLEKSLDDERGKLNGLLADMFKRAGQEPKPVHLMKRALLEAKVTDLSDKLSLLKTKSPDVAALIEYDTINEYARQLRENGFVWTKSRQKLLQDVLTGALTSRPVAALMGETGTGKTAMARAAAIELSSREPERTVGGDQEKFVRLLASPAIEEGKTSYEYGPLLRAMTGLASSKDKPSDSRGGGIFFDDEFNTRPTSVQRQILKFVSECRPGRKVTVPGTPLTVTVEPGFLYLAAGNPPSERYDREETGIETKREFAGNVLNVEYLEQTPDNPELYQVLLASLLDQKTGRLTAVTPQEIQPGWVKADAATGVKSLDLDPRSGAFLWRFSQAWGELFKAFSHKDTVLHKKNPGKPKAEFHLPSFILDPGVVLSWVDQYKASPRDRKKHLGEFLMNKLTGYLDQFPPEEQKTVSLYLTHFDLPKVETTGKGKDKTITHLEVDKPTVTVLTPKDVGFLNPNVPRPREKTQPPKAEGVDIIDPETGEVIGTRPIEEKPPKPESQEAANLQEARDILGADNVLGSEALKATWDVDLLPEDIPQIPYSQEQLEGAKRMNMMLILRIDRDATGAPLTGERMHEIIEPKLQAAGKGKFLYKVDWYPNEAFFKTSTPKAEWKLVTRDLLPNSVNLYYADQTRLLRDTLASQPDLTPQEQAAIAQADDATLDRLKTAASSTDDAIWKPAATELAALSLNRNHRRSFADTIFDHASLLQTQNTRLFNGQSVYDWTSDRTSGGGLVDAGGPDSGGLHVGRWFPGGRDGSLGVSLSR